jgi:hypothetical protein
LKVGFNTYLRVSGVLKFLLMAQKDAGPRTPTNCIQYTFRMQTNKIPIL